MKRGGDCKAKLRSREFESRSQSRRSSSVGWGGVGVGMHYRQENGRFIEIDTWFKFIKETESSWKINLMPFTLSI